MSLLFSQPWSDHLCQKSSCRMRADACAELCHVYWLRSAGPQPWEGGLLQLLALCCVGRGGHLFTRDSSGALGSLCHMSGGPNLSHHHTLETCWINAEAGAQTPHNVRAGAQLQPRHSTNTWDGCICIIFKISCNAQLDLRCCQLKYNHTISRPWQKNWYKLFLSCVAHFHPHAIGCFSLRCVHAIFCLFMKFTISQITKNLY